MLFMNMINTVVNGVSLFLNTFFFKILIIMREKIKSLNHMERVIWGGFAYNDEDLKKYATRGMENRSALPPASAI